MGMCPKCLLAGGNTENDSHQEDIPSSLFESMSFGDYELIEEIARGGMGVVYRALQKSLNREVALKMILSGKFASIKEVDRFVAEAEAAAHLRHPHIVAVHEVGEVNGRHFYSMDLIRGCDLALRTQENPLSSRQAAAYLIKVARAVHFAHQRGVIHRDLKPQNILVDEFNEPRITDFGLAKRMDLESGLTWTGTVFGSPSYMAPEQANGRQDQIGPKTDVFALGAVLYYLLSGRPPFLAATPLETFKKVIDTEPDALSVSHPDISPDLETICLKCLEKDQTHRYASASELADELERWTNNQPIKARRSTVRERATKWMQRNPIVTSMSMMILAIGVTGFALVWWQLQKTQDALRQSEQLLVAEVTARAVELPAYRVLPHDSAVSTAVFSADGQRVLSASHDHTARLWDAVSGEIIQQYRGHQGVAGCAIFSPDESQVLTYSFDTQFRYPHLSPTDQHMLTTRIPRFSDQSVRIWDAVSGRQIFILPHPNHVVDASFSPDGKRVVTAGWDHQARIWDTETGNELHALKHHKAALLSGVFSPDGRRVIVTSSGYDYQLNITAGGGGGVTSSVDEAFLASIWNPSNGQLLGTVKNRSRDHFLFGGQRSSRCKAEFSADGKWGVIAGAEPSNLIIWNMERDRVETVLNGHQAEVLGARFSQDGLKLISYSVDETARIWDVETGKETALLAAHTAPVLWAEFDPNGKFAVTASGDGTARVWNADTGVGMVILKGHTEKVYQARFSPDGLRVVTASEDGEVRLLDAATMTQLSKVLRGHEQKVMAIDFSADGKHVVTGSHDLTARIWDIATGDMKSILKGYEAINDEEVRDNALGDVIEVRFSPDGASIVTSSEDSRAILRQVDRSRNPLGEDTLMAPYSPVRMWDLESGSLIQEFPSMETGANASKFSPDGKQMLSIPNGEVSESIRSKSFLGRGWSSSSKPWSGPIDIPVWDLETGETLFAIEGLNLGIHDIAFSPDGRWIATADSGTARLWDALTGKEIRQFDKSSEAMRVQFTPDSRHLLMKEIGGLGVWEVASGKQIRQFESPEIPFIDAQLHASGKYVTAWNTVGTVCLFDIDSEQAVFKKDKTAHQLRKALLNPDATLLVTIGWEKEARVWDVKTGDLLKTLEGHEDDILDAAISPDGKWLGTVSEYYTARLWPLNVIPTSAERKTR